MKTLLEANTEWIKRKKQTPPTVKDVLLEKWKNDTGAMAEMMIYAYFNGRIFMFDDGFRTENGETAIEHWIDYLNSPAEVEK